MKMTKHEADQHAADYADSFNAPDKAPHQMSDDEAFGLSEPDPAAGGAPEGSAAEEAAESPAEEAAEQAQGEGAEPGADAAAEPGADAAADAPHGEQPTGEVAPSPADQEQRLKSWEGRLKARQAELDAREAAMGDSSVNDQQASMPLDGDGDSDGDGDGPGDADGDGDGDPASVLANDFGADFVDQLTKLIKQVSQECVGGVSAQVDQVIAALQNDRLTNHFNAIASTHADFMDVVESPEFESWKASQPDQERIQKVIDSGTAPQIVGLLSAFKAAHKTGQAGTPDSGGADDDALDAAEGVRSSGLSLPKEPVPDDDFARAWNEA